MSLKNQEATELETNIHAAHKKLICINSHIKSYDKKM